MDHYKQPTDWPNTSPSPSVSHISHNLWDLFVANTLCYNELPEDLQQLSKIIIPIIEDIKKHFPRIKWEKEFIKSYFWNPNSILLREQWNIHYTWACLEYCRLFIDLLEDYEVIKKISCDTYLCLEKDTKTHKKSFSIHTTVSFFFQEKQYSIDNMQATSFHLYPWKKFFRKFDWEDKLFENQKIIWLLQVASVSAKDRWENEYYIDAIRKKYPYFASIIAFCRKKQIEKYISKLDSDLVQDVEGYRYKVFPRNTWDMSFNQLIV